MPKRQRSPRTRRVTARSVKRPRPKGGRVASAAKAAPRKGAKKAPTSRTKTAKRANAAHAKARRAKVTPAKTVSPVKKGAAKGREAKAKEVARQVPASQPAQRRRPQLDRDRRVLRDDVPTPPSSLDMNRRGSAVRTGRAEMAQLRRNLGAMSRLTGGDPDGNAEEAYFSGDEAPGGDNPTPDQDIVDEIGKTIGVEYQDNEELQGADKVIERDRHRWELDPASSEDYKDRK